MNPIEPILPFAALAVCIGAALTTQPMRPIETQPTIDPKIVAQATDGISVRDRQKILAALCAGLNENRLDGERSFWSETIVLADGSEIYIRWDDWGDHQSIHANWHSATEGDAE